MLVVFPSDPLPPLDPSPKQAFLSSSHHRRSSPCLSYEFPSRSFSLRLCARDKPPRALPPLNPLRPENTRGTCAEEVPPYLRETICTELSGESEK